MIQTAKFFPLFIILLTFHTDLLELTTLVIHVIWFTYLRQQLYISFVINNSLIVYVIIWILYIYITCSTVISIGYIRWEPRKLLELVFKPFVYVIYIPVYNKICLSKDYSNVVTVLSVRFYQRILYQAFDFTSGYCIERSILPVATVSSVRY